MKKHLIITKLFDTGGSNTHLKLLLQYLGEENVILILENREQVAHLQNIATSKISFKVITGLHAHAHLKYRFTTNVRELALIIRSLFIIYLFFIKHGCKTLTISSVEPEKHLYLLWLPFIKVNYILHTSPPPVFTSFTTATCNYRLGKQKHIVAVSQYMQHTIARQWKIKSRTQQFIKVVHNSVAEPVVVPRQQYINSAIKNILTVGRVDANKNPAIWLAAAKIILATRPDVSFTWLGNGPELAYYTSLADGNTAITFTGMVKNPQPYYQAAAIYFQPSYEESHGIAVLEAMYNSLPCVVANVGGLPESVLQNHNGLLVNPANVDDCVRALTYLLDNAEVRKTYGENSHKRYHHLFSYKNFTTQMDALY